MYSDYKNTRIHYRIKGNPSGPAVMLIHGFTETAAMWKPLINVLKEKYFLFLPDLLGHYKSGLTGDVLTMEEQAEMLARLMTMQGIEKVHLIGHSMGGYISLALAELYPEKVQSITLLNSHPYADPADKIEGRRKGVQAVLQDKYAYLSQTIPGFFAAYNREKFSGEIDKLIRKAMKMPARGIAGALRGMMTRKDRSSLFFHQKNYASAWIISKDDPLIDPGFFQREAEKDKELYFKIIEGGHMSYIENPSEMIKVISDFLHNLEQKNK